MKAIVQDRYGTPEMLRLRDVDTPTIDDNGILVEVRAAAVNALDWHMTRGMPYVIRLGEGLRKPRSAIRGVDVAGRVTAVGSAVTRFKVGDDVFGGTNGSFAEFAATTVDRLAHKPAALTYEQAAAMHVAGLTALQALRDKARVQAGQRVLINGAGGGVGVFAVQLAKWLGTHVTAVTRTESSDRMRMIGADEVIDYRKQDFTQQRERYDVVIDIGGNRPFLECRRVMTPTGVLVVVGGPAGALAPATRLLGAAALSPFISQTLLPFISKNDADGLALLAQLAEQGKLTPVMDASYALRETAQAIRHVGEGRARGKVTINVAGA